MATKIAINGQISSKPIKKFKTELNPEPKAFQILDRNEFDAPFSEAKVL